MQKADEISRLVPEARVAYAHGQMTGNQIEEIMQDFIDKKSNVLVCTTILESGIDIPNANTINLTLILKNLLIRDITVIRKCL